MTTDNLVSSLGSAPANDNTRHSFPPKAFHMNRIRIHLGVALLLAFFAAGVASADNWPSWRGPNANGVAVGSGYPLKWSAEENVLWKFTLPGPGSSTPVIWGQQVFVTSGGGGQNVLLSVGRDGKQQWRVTVGKERPGKSRKASGSNSSPVTDGRHVFAYFKSGDLACCDFSGKLLWRKNLQEMYGKDTLWWDLGTSPVLTKKHVIVACMQTGPSYVVAFDKLSGQVAWKHDRMLDAPVEAAQSYTTPLVVQAGGRETVLVVGADHATAHDAANGDELWRVGGLNPSGNKYFRSISSPVLAGDLLVAPYARGGSLTAIRLGGSGDVTQSHVAWTSGPSADVPTPVVHQGKIYVCRDRGDLLCFDLKTGKKIWTHKLPKGRKGYSSSPTLAAGHLYVPREDGMVFVVRVGDQPKLVAENRIDEQTVASPVLVDGRLWLRTEKTLYCIGNSGAE